MEVENLEILVSKFSKESQYALMKFADGVRKSDVYCDMNTYEIWKYFEVEKNSMEVSDNKEEINNSNQTNKFEKLVDLRNMSVNIAEESEIQELTDEDVTASLKEHFKSADNVPAEFFENLLRSPETIGRIFINLSGVLNSEQILMFGKSLEFHLQNDLIMEYFCRCLLTKMTTIFTEDLKILFLRLCCKFDSRIVPHIVTTIESTEKVDILSLYLTPMESTFQESLLSEVLRTQTNFTEKYVLIVKCLVNKDMQYNTLKKLIEVLANNVDQYATDKEYGNLVFKVVTYLGKNSSRLENILRHILNNHKSIWKAKIQKTLPPTHSQEI